MVDYTRTPPNALKTQQVWIHSVDVVNQSATGYSNSGTAVSINTSHYVGAIQVTPTIGDQWLIQKINGEYRLLSRIPFNDPNQNIVPTQGQYIVGSGQGPVELSGTQVNVDAPTMRIGTTLYRDNSGTLEYQIAGSTSWTPVASGGGGGTSWTSITGKPSTFPPTVPINWSDITGNPATYPPTLPTGTASTSTFWRGDDTWAVPPGTGGGGSGALIVGDTLSPNGVITTFTLSGAFTANSTMVYINGIRQYRGTDYTESGTTQIVFVTAPTGSDLVTVDFVLAGVGDNLIVGEVPSGTINGSNTTFTAAHAFIPSSTSVFLNGLREQLSIGYTESGTTQIVFVTPPLSGDLVTVDYLLAI